MTARRDPGSGRCGGRARSSPRAIAAAADYIGSAAALFYGRFDFHLLRNTVTPSRNEPPKLAGYSFHSVQ